MSIMPILHSKDPKNTVNFSISNRTIVRVLVMVVLTLVFMAALRRAAHSLMLLFTAFFLALALNGPVHWLAVRIPGKRRGSRVLATAASFIIVIGLLIGFFASIVPPIVRQTDNFISAAPRLVEDVRNQDSVAGQFIRKYHLQQQVSKLSTQLSSRLGNIGGTAASAAGKIGSSIFAMLTILALTFMMLIEGPRWVKLFEEMLPHDHREHVMKLSSDMYRVVKGYVNGQVLLAALASLLIFPAILVSGVSYPVALMFVVFVCGLIPMVGHTIGAVIVTTVALFHSPIAAIGILSYYILYQQIENYVVQPRIQANSTNMSPLLVFASVVIGVNFGGLFGGLVAIPVAGCLRIAVLDYLQNRHILSAADAASEETKRV